MELTPTNDWAWIEVISEKEADSIMAEFEKFADTRTYGEMLYKPCRVILVGSNFDSSQHQSLEPTEDNVVAFVDSRGIETLTFGAKQYKIARQANIVAYIKLT